MPARILLPVSDSAESKNGVQAAGIFAGAVDADVTIIHALYPEWFRFLMVPDIFSGPFMEKERALSASVLSEAFDELKKYGIAAKMVAVEGRPEDIISRVSDNFDLLVLGAKVHGDLWEVLVGSIPSELIRIVKKPIMVIKNGAPPPRRSGRIRFLCALDYSPISERAVKFLCRMGTTGALEASLVHVIDHVELGVDLMGDEEREKTLEKARKNAEALLAGYAAELTNAGVEARLLIEEGKATDAMAKLSKEEECDFILSGRPKVSDITQRVFDSMCHHLFHNTPINQIIIS